jgi:protein TIF31
MALIEYRGYRIIAQCIIPGILTADQLQCSQYGSIDDGKTISDNKEFEFIMVKVCERMGLDSSVEFMDEKGVRKRIAGSIEVKGILGSDKRKYILDLMRLSPRDYNWGGSDGMTCVLRDELIDQFKDVHGKNTMGLTVGKELDVKINVNLETGVEFTKTDQTEKQ